MICIYRFEVHIPLLLNDLTNVYSYICEYIFVFFYCVLFLFFIIIYTVCVNIFCHFIVFPMKFV